MGWRGAQDIGKNKEHCQCNYPYQGCCTFGAHDIIIYIMFTVEKLVKSFKTDFWAKSFYALDDVSFTVERGQTVGFLGANGAGKTTLLKILMGLIYQDTGEIRFHDDLGVGQEQIFANLGFLPERPYFYPYLTGRDFLCYMGKLQQLSPAVQKEKIASLSERLQIAHALDRKIRGYSKGMLQRLGLASTLMHDPMMVVLDEPLSGLDPVGRKEFKDILQSLGKEGKTVFFSSHIVPDVEEICDNIVLLEKGKLVYQGRMDEIIAKGVSPKFCIKISHGEIPEMLMAHYDEKKEVLEVSVEEKEKVIAQLLEHNCKIISLYQNRLTLEEIIYRT